MQPISYANRLGASRPELSIPEDKRPWTEVEALFEAGRCLYCHDAPCSQRCPAGVDVPEFIRSIRTGSYKAAARLLLTVNRLAETCGCVCPTEVLCRGECVLPHIDGQQPIAINRLQRFVVQWAREQQIDVFERREPTGKRVALVGAGPASIACAHELARLGHRAVIHEAHELPGGLNAAAIAPHKMHADLPLAEADWLLRMGVEVQTGTAVGRDIGFDELERGHDAVFIGTGLGPDRRLSVPGEKGTPILGAIELLRQLKTSEVRELPYKRVLCVGGGNSAIDVVRTLVDLGVPEVALVYRRTEDQMKGYAHEWMAARFAGVEAHFLTQPVEVLLDGGQVRGLRCVRMSPGELDESGRPRPVPVEGSEHDFPGDAVILALGQAGPGEVLEGIPAGVRFDGNRIAVAPETGATGHPGLYAGGDCANGGKEVVNAATEGLRAARAIDMYLSGKGE